MPVRYLFRFPESLYGLSGAAGESKEGSDTSLASSSSDSSSSSEFAFQIRPDYHEGLVDIITHYGWEKIIYVYRLEKTSFSIWEMSYNSSLKKQFSDFDGLLRLQNIYNSIPRDDRGVFSFQVEMVKKVSFIYMYKRHQIIPT